MREWAGARAGRSGARAAAPGRHGQRGRVGPALGGTVWLVEVGERRLVAKVGPGCLDEGDGLRQLGAAPGAPPVPDVVLGEDDLLVRTAVDQASRTARHDEMLGQSLVRLHRDAAPHWGGGSSWIGACPVDPFVAADGATFYGSRLLDLAARCALVHGDLWWGNVLFGVDGRAWLIDPSVHGGHAEEDLAMLALFGAVPDRLLKAYDEVHPLPAGWRERIALFQLAPLLVHALLFGDGYRSQAEAVAGRYA